MHAEMPTSCGIDALNNMEGVKKKALLNASV